MSIMSTEGPFSHGCGMMEEVLGLGKNISTDFTVFFVVASGDHMVYRVSGQLRPVLACLKVW